ncbi:hypothetical protein EU524_01815 [Candidatus Thorarchaeota archaeon]|nr:MAG: hypothetical protein EU524_01815 [Candidatus Thorarchaeota archaeon]
MDSRRIIKRLVRFIYEYWILAVVLVFALYIWSLVFDAAVVDYFDTARWNTRAVWLGDGIYEIFGYTVHYQLEGYSDYSFFYVHWGHNMLKGVMPYCEDFGSLLRDGVLNQNGLYIFPPFTAFFYALGTLLPFGDIGIAYLIVALAFLTVFPVYGLARHFSGNRHVGEIAALTYLLNPLVLYHIVFCWFNPAPFIFFFMSGFYFLVRGRRHVGTLLIVVAALFKQTAWFLGIPLVVYLIVRPRPAETSPSASPELESYELRATLARWSKKVIGYFDPRGFAISTIMVVSFVGAVMFPFLLAQKNTLLFMGLAAGGYPLESFTELPPYTSPMRLQVLPVVAGFPDLAQILDLLVYNRYLLVIATVVVACVMLIEPKREGQETGYLRRILFLAMILMLLVNLTGPRGVYKYYFTLFAPFFSIFSSRRMIERETSETGPTLSMLVVPFLLSAAILLPGRNVYLFAVLLIFVGFLLSNQVARFWTIVTTPVRYVARVLRDRTPHRLEDLKRRWDAFHDWLYTDISRGDDGAQQPAEGEAGS